MSELRWILLGCGVVLLLGIFAWGRRSRGQAANPDDLGGHGRMDPPMTYQGAVPSAAHAASGSDMGQSMASRWQDDEWTSTVADLPEIRFDATQSFDEPLAADEEVLLPAAEGIVAEPDRTDRQSVRHSFQENRAAVDPSPELPREPPREPVRTKPKVTDKRKIVALRLSAVLPERYPGGQLRMALEAQGLTHGRYGIFHRLDEATGSSILSVASMVEPGAFDLATMNDAAFAGVTLFAMLPGPLPAAAMCDQLLACARQLEETLGGVLHDDRGVPLTSQKAEAIRNEMLDFEHLLGGAAAAPLG